MTSTDQTSYHIRIGTISLLAFHSVDGFGWIRIFGAGLYWKDTTKCQMDFSERNGNTKALKFNNWRISFLPYCKH